MTAARRRAISTPGDRQDPSGRNRWSGPLSIALHVVIVVVLLRVTVIPGDWMDALLRLDEPAPVERIGFLQLPRGEPPREAPRRGGDNRPLAPEPAPAPTPIAPAEVPAALPTAPATVRPPAAEGGTGPLVGGGGDTQGVRPSFTDPRLWAPTAPVVTAPLSGTLKLDSAIAPIFRELADSMRAAAAAGRDPTDWTFNIGGKRYGMDRQYIRLGPVSIPTAALAFLPLNVQGNPTAIDRDRRLGQMRDEIIAQAMRAARDEDFQKAVQALRERKQRERAEAKKTGEPPPRITP